MNATIPASIDSIDLRFVERDGKRILQWRRAQLAPFQHFVSPGPPYEAAHGTFAYMWGEWEDVRVEAEK